MQDNDTTDQDFTMRIKTALFSIFSVAQLAGAGDAAAQHRTPSPFAPVVEAGARLAEPAAAAERPGQMESPSRAAPIQAFENRSLSNDRMMLAAFVGTIGAAAGAYGGALLGFMSAYGESDELASTVVGAAAGSVVGSTAGAGLVTGRPGPALVGSLGGGILGTFLWMVADGSGMGPLLFAASQGIGAAWVASR